MKLPHFRIRVALHEYELTGSEVLIGRSGECQVALEDPMVSRRHARIELRAGVAKVFDLGSRNGVVVNGERVNVSKLLHNGDRIRIGTQEMVFQIAAERREARKANPTGALRHCSRCTGVYSDLQAACPECNEPNPGMPEEKTLTQVGGLGNQQWKFQLLAEVMERALCKERDPRAEGILKRAAEDVDASISRGYRIDPRYIETIAVYAIRLCNLTEQPHWLRWVFDVHSKQWLFPTLRVLDELDKLSSGLRSVVFDEAHSFLKLTHQRPGVQSAEENAKVARIIELAKKSSAGSQPAIEAIVTGQLP